MPRARGSSPPRVARQPAPAADPLWPPQNIRALIRELRGNRASPHWEALRLTVLSMAGRVRGHYTDVPDEPDDIAQLVLLTFSEQDSLAQFGRPAEALSVEQRWSRDRFLAWLFQCVQNTWRMRRRQTLARPVTVDLAAHELAELSGQADDLTLVESAADGSLLAHKVTRLLAVWEERSPTARAQAHCFRAYAQALLEEKRLDEDALAELYKVQPGTIRVWLHRIRLRLQEQLQGTDDTPSLEASGTARAPGAEVSLVEHKVSLPSKMLHARDD